MQKLKAETFKASQPSRAQIGAVGSSGATNVCFNCNGYGHVAKQCPSWQNFNRESSGPNRNKICHRCNKTGHISRNCYANQPSSSSVNTPVSENISGMNKEREVVCFCCGKQGHILKYCRTQIQSQTGGSDQGQNPQNPQTQSKGQSAQKDSKVTFSSVSP